MSKTMLALGACKTRPGTVRAEAPEGPKEPVLSLGKHWSRPTQQVHDGSLVLDSSTSLASGKQEKERCRNSRKSDLRFLLAELKACSSTRNLQKGRRLHAEAMRSGDDCNVYVATALLNMYAKCKSMVSARRVFDSIKDPDVAAWNALISGYAENREGTTALNLVERMRSDGCSPNSRTFVALVKACSSIAVEEEKCMERVKQVHLLASESGYADMYVKNALIDIYAKSGSIVSAQKVFDSMRTPDVVSWNALIMAYALNGQGFVALNLFSKMRSEGYQPNARTLVAALKAYTSLAVEQGKIGGAECIEQGRQLHLLASDIGCDTDHYVQATLIDMYAKCGSIIDARRVFDNMISPGFVSWSALIFGYVENGDGATAWDLFARMRSRGCELDSGTLVAALKACASLTEEIGHKECSERTKLIHLLAVEISCDANVQLQTSLVDTYAKCGSMADAQKIFKSMRNPDVASWSALILGYADNGESVAALDLFVKMRSQGCVPNSITFVGALKACALLGALELGRKFHGEILDRHVKPDVILVNCLVDFYAKCGSLVEAHQVFSSHSTTSNLVTWTTLLAGHSRLGNVDSVFELFQAMQDAGYQPNNVAFTCILTCCSHAGLVDKGKQCFDTMFTKYGVTPAIEHYNCMVDILGRSNKLNSALDLIRSMPYTPDMVTWTAVLSACRKWRNVEIGRLAFDSLVGLDRTNAAPYLLMAHIFIDCGMQEEGKRVLGMRAKSGPWKMPGQSWWTNDVGEVHAFLVWDSKQMSTHSRGS